jgi:hypothetical protein
MAARILNHELPALVDQRTRAVAVELLLFAAFQHI